jgi:hypothetical protein
MHVRATLAATLLALVAVFAVFPPALAVAAEATPPTDCPPGSAGKASGEFAWCEPTVCENDPQCGPGQLCRTVKLCVEIGKIGDAGGKLGAAPSGADKLIATGLCVGAEKACPASTVCSEKKRCLDRAAAQKMNLLEEPKPAPSAGGTAEPARKSSCGCAAVGAPSESALSTGCALVIAGALVQRARRRRVREAVPRRCS